MPLDMAEPGVLILTAVRLEGRAVAKGLGIRAAAPGEPSRGRVGGREIVLHWIGVGARSLGDIEPEGAGWAVILAGLAGALDPSLQVGDVVVDGPVTSPPAGVRLGKILSVDHLVSTPAEKEQLHRETGASAVDMETGAVTAWAERQGLPLWNVRAISDRADQTLNPDLLHLIDPWGRPRPLRVARRLLGGPSRVKELRELGRAANFAAGRLAAAIADLLRSGTIHAR